LPLVCAAREGQIEAVRELLALGACPGSLDPWGRSAHEMARLHRHQELADLLAKAERGELGTAPNGGPVEPRGNPGVSGGPPSVS
jgi:ankyrin repeat protein